MKISKRLIDLFRYFAVALCGYLSSSEGVINLGGGTGHSASLESVKTLVEAIPAGPLKGLDGCDSGSVNY